MKKTLLKTLLLTCLLSVWGMNAHAATLDIENGTFEDWTDTSTPVGWASNTGSNATLSQSTDCYSGTYAVSIAHVSNNNRRMASKDYTLSAGTYNVSFYAKSADSDALGMLSMGYVPITNGSAGTYNYVNTQVSIPDTWTEQTFSFTLTAETTLEFIVMNHQNGSGAVLVDDYTVTYEESETQSGHGYEPNDPYSASEALAIAKELDSSTTISSVYVKGIISQIDEISTSYGNATYYISDDGTTTNQLEIYRGYSLNGDKFTSEDEIKVGDEVIVYGDLVDYSGNTPEITTGSKIYSLNGSTEAPDSGGGGGDEGYHDGDVSTSSSTLTLTNPDVSVGTETTSIDFTTEGLTNAESVNGREFTFDDGSTVIFAKGDGTSDPAWYDTNTAIRVYADNTLTFTCEKVIAKIELHDASSSYNGNTSTETVEFSDDGMSAIYCNLWTSTSGGTQLRVQSITITYAGEGGDEEPEPDTGDEHTFNFAENTYGMTVYSGNDSDYETEVTQITSDGVVLNFDSGHYRMWNSSGEGNHLRIGGAESSNNDAYCTISGPTGSKVLEVVITSTGSSDNMSASNPTVEPEGGSYASHVYTWTGEAESVTFHFTSVTHVYYIDVTLSAETGSFSISSAGYATYYIEDAYVMPEGVTGTTVTGVEGEQTDGGYLLDMAWKYEAGTTVPAKTALVLKGEEGKYTYTITSAEEVAPTDNLLMGSTSETTTTGPNGETTGYVFYELTNGTYGIGFYWGADEGVAFTSGANKAWLPLTETQSRNARFLGFGDGDDTTGISSVSASEGASVKGIYTIQGIRVSNMNQPGLYIVDGRKVLKR